MLLIISYHLSAISIMHARKKRAKKQAASSTKDWVLKFSLTPAEVVKDHVRLEMYIAHLRGENDLMITRTLELVLFLRLLRAIIIWYKYGDDNSGRRKLAISVDSGCMPYFRGICDFCWRRRLNDLC